MAEQAPFNIFTAFVFAYGVGTLHLSRDFILSAVWVASCVSFVSIPLSGHISDRIGRKKMYLIGASLGYQLASVIAGGPAPIIATALFAAYHTGYAIAINIAACSVVSLVSAALMPDYTGKDVSMEYDD